MDAFGAAFRERLYTLYECGCCECYHPWDWDGDCRDDANRYGSPEEYAERQGISVYAVEVRSAEDRAEADEAAEDRTCTSCGASPCLESCGACEYDTEDRA